MFLLPVLLLFYILILYVSVASPPLLGSPLRLEKLKAEIGQNSPLIHSRVELWGEFLRGESRQEGHFKYLHVCVWFPG